MLIGHDLSKYDYMMLLMINVKMEKNIDWNIRLKVIVLAHTL